jgi:hypothetical protein
MAKADIAAGRAFVSLYIKGSAFTKGLAKAQKELRSFGSGIMGIGAAVSGMGLAISGGFAAAVGQFSTTGAALQKLATQTGVSAGELSALQFAAMQSGAEFDDISGSLEELNIRMGEVARDGTGPAAEAFKTLGLNADELGAMLPIDRLMEVGDALAGVQDAAMRQFLADEIIGGDAFRILPLLIQGRKGMEDLMKAGRDLGVVLSDEDAKSASSLSQAFGRMGASMQAIINQIGSALAPLAMELAEAFVGVASSVIKFVKNNKALIVTAAKIAAVITAAGAAIVAIGASFVGAGLAIGGLLSAISAFSAAASLVSAIIGAVGAALGLLLTPVGLIGVALVAGAAAWLQFSQTGQTAVRTLVGSVTTLFAGLSATVSATFGGIIDAIRGGDLALAGQIAMVGLRLVIAQGVEAITGLFGNAIGSIVAKILNGDLTGAWASVGSSILKTWANVAKSIVNIFTEAIRAIDKALDGRISKISKAMAIIKDGEGGIIKAAFTSLLPSKEKDDPLNKALNAIDEAAKFVAEATDMAASDAMGGAGEGASQAVKDLKAELDALRKQAAEKMEAGRIGSPEEDEIDQPGSGQKTGGMGGRASVATNSLAALAQMAQGPQNRMERLAQQQIKKQEDQIEVLEDVAMGIRNMGLFHA